MKSCKRSGASCAGHQNRKYGYIIILMVISGDVSPEEILSESADFKTVWKVLNALRAHDSHVNIFVEEIKLHRGKSGDKLIGGDEHITTDAAQNVFYPKLEKRIGNRRA